MREARRPRDRLELLSWDAGAEAKLRRLERGAQNFEQVGAVHGQIWRAELLAEVTAFGA